MRNVAAEKFRFVSIRRKIFYIQMAVVISAVMLMGMVGFFYYSRIMNEKIDHLVRQNNEQAMENIEIILNNVARLTEYPMLDGEIWRILNKDYAKVPEEMRKYERIRDNKEMTDAIYNGIFYGNSYVHSVEWVAENTQSLHGTGVSLIGDVDTYEKAVETEWYQEIARGGGVATVLDPHWDGYLAGEEPCVSVGRNLVDDIFSNQSAGVIKINLNKDALRHVMTLTNWSDAGLSALLDADGDMICSVAGEAFQKEEVDFLKELPALSEEGHTIVWRGEKYERYVQESSVCDWTLLRVIPHRILYAELISFKRALFLLMAVMGLILIGVSYLISGFITRPVLELTDKLKQMHSGNWNVRARSGNDEIGALGETFNAMAQRLQDSVEEIYRTEQGKREAELMALQAQINPHFLYNTLRSIRWMSDVQGADNVTEAIDGLIQLFRLTTQIRGELISIGEDLHIIRLYSEILMIRYMDGFKVAYSVDEALLECRTVKFLLQPLLENAIYHGFANWRKEGLIRITVRQEEENILFEVYDNGCGMDEETVRRVLDEAAGGGNGNSAAHTGMNKIGIANVNQRIKFAFGEKYGLSFESEAGKYTIARAVIPRREKAQCNGPGNTGERRCAEGGDMDEGSDH